MNSLKISPRLTKLIDNADDNVVLHTKYECDDWKCFLLLFTSACACSYNKLVLHVWSRKKFELFISKNIWKFLYSLYCFSLVYYPKIPKHFGNFRSVNIFLDHFEWKCEYIFFQSDTKRCNQLIGVNDRPNKHCLETKTIEGIMEQVK